jgi:major membrane immunogen (membrane-anchored lipoprotein)
MNKKKAIIMITSTILLTGCVNDDENDIRMLKAAGYTNPQITMHGSMTISCGTIPTGPMMGFHREFKAMKNGKEIEGIICASAFGDSIKEK